MWVQDEQVINNFFNKRVKTLYKKQLKINIIVIYTRSGTLVPIRAKSADKTRVLSGST